MKKTLAILLVFGIYSLNSVAQQEPMFTHYMFNKLQYNPAYSNLTEALAITGLHRSQWVGFKGAPITQSIVIQTPIFTENLGLGISILNDKLGPIKTISFFGDIAYKLKLGAKSRLSFGIKGGVTLMSSDLSQIELENNGDLTLQESQGKKVLPNVGAGLYYQHSSFYIGVSSPKLLESDLNGNYGENFQLRANRHYFIDGGLDLNLNKQTKIKPFTLVKITKGAAVQVDLTVLLEYDELVWIGPMFRFGDGLGFLAGAYITNQLKIGYSFDYSLALKTAKYNSGSHEIMLRYDFAFTEKKKIRSPRYF